MDRGMLSPVTGPGAAKGLEEDLVEKARGGDRAAFDRLVASHLSGVWRVAWRIVRDPTDAEDVVQETFLTAWRSIPEFRGDAAFSTWLHRIATTRALNHLDRAAERLRRRSRPLEGPLEDGETDPVVERAVGNGLPDPFTVLEGKERVRRLADCFEKLPAAFRAVVALRDGESRAYDEIASILGIELGTVRSRLARARLSLRDCVEGAKS